MAAPVPNGNAGFEIPSVDISPYLADQSSPAAEDVVNRIRAACTTSGFFQVTGHGIPETLRDAVLNAAKAVFDLPHEEKLKLAGIPGRGYEAIGDQVLEPGKKADLKEVSHYPTVRWMEYHRVFLASIFVILLSLETHSS